MFSIIIGYVIGQAVMRPATGLIFVMLYGVGAGIITANVTYRDNAVLTVPILAIVGFILAWVVRWVRGIRAARS